MRWILLLLPLPLALAQGDWRLSKRQSETLGELGSWSYTLSPRTEEARVLWQALVLQYREHLKGGYRVDLGRWRLYFRGGALLLDRGCPEVHPACLTPGALPAPKERQDRFLLEMAGLLDRALGELEKIGGRLTLSGLFRADLKPKAPPPHRAYPSGWKP
ncbi:hypothetical protein Theos_0463 [Thermus oshimai JL-2]|uniref:Uncharacterized protein n=1 Tax=Thermus oshimai JL-2 TaxID=751945 RepID=K7QY75_THEOS|nr:hypothetical protein [Thermus oshimai]AFV75535.1 hypothetical protein Theos_0463 [Thermus oshimai JL-2]